MGAAVQVSARKRPWILANIMISTIASSLLMTALNTALTPICADIGITVATGKWLVSGETLAIGIVMPLTAFLIRRVPTRKLYLTGIVVFICGLTLAMVSPNFAIMMCGRVLQGCGNGLLLSMAQVVILSIFPEEKKGSIMGMYGLAISVAPVIAPTLGGILVDTLGWRSIFAVVLVVMVISLIMAIVVFANVLETTNIKFDVLSFIISALAFGGITLGVGNLANDGITSPMVFIPLVVGIAAMVVFILRQVKSPKPFLDVKILKVPAYATAVICSMLLYFVMMGSSILMPLYVQQVMGRTATISGLVTLPGSLAMGVISPFAGKLYDKFGIKRLAILGSIFLVLSNICMITLGMNSPLYVASIFNVIRNVAIGCMLMPMITWGTSRVNKSLVADATALLSSFRTIAGSIGSAVFSGVMSAVAVSAAVAYGDRAELHGMHIAFVGMACASTILVLITIFLVDRKKKAQG